MFEFDADGTVVGTGSINGNEIKRVFVLPQFQGRGYGTALMNELEARIAKDYNEIVLDSSLPAYSLYLKRGYMSVKYEKIVTSNEDVLCCNVMKKSVI
jgi:ribosomal protein S18 acetylase RimI-like enzyme